MNYEVRAMTTKGEPMARKSRQDELFEKLRAGGLRKRVAKSISEATGRANRNTPNSVKKVANDLRALASEIEDRATGGPAKRKAAAKKAANTRKRNASKRSAAARWPRRRASASLRLCSRPPVRSRALEAGSHPHRFGRCRVGDAGGDRRCRRLLGSQSLCDVRRSRRLTGGRLRPVHPRTRRHGPAWQFDGRIDRNGPHPLSRARRVCAPGSRGLSAVLVETLTRPAGPGAAVLIEHVAQRMIATLEDWLNGDVTAGRIRDLPRPVLIQQLISPCWYTP